MKSLRTNATLNAIKQLCGIMFPIISFSYASRVVGAEGIGVYSFAQSIISYMLLIASIGITNYAVREGARIRDDKEQLCKFCNEVFSINIVFTLFAYIILFILMVSWGRLGEYRYALLIQSTAILLTTLGADWINTVFEDYLYLTIRYIVVHVLSLIAMFLFVKSPDDLYKYIVICTISSFGGNVFNFFYIRKRVSLKFTFLMKFSVHIIPLSILFFNSIASVIYLNSDITILEIFTNDREVGIYTVSTKVYSVLKTLINGITYVTVPRFSYYLGNNLQSEYRDSFNKLLDALMIITIPAAVGIFMLSSDILLLFAGEGYESGGLVIRILSIAFPFAVGSCLFSYAVLIPNSLEKYFMTSTIIAATTNILLNLVLIPRYGMNGAATTTLLAEIIVFSLTLYYSRKYIDSRRSIRKCIAVVLGASLIAVVCYLISLRSLSVVNRTFISIAFSVAVYAIALYVFKVPEVVEAFVFIKKQIFH